MAKTDVGCQVLQDKGHFTEFAAFIRRHGLESEDQDMILKLKSVLWAVVSYIKLSSPSFFPRSESISGKHWGNRTRSTFLGGRGHNPSHTRNRGTILSPHGPRVCDFVNAHLDAYNSDVYHIGRASSFWV